MLTKTYRLFCVQERLVQFYMRFYSRLTVRFTDGFCKIHHSVTNISEVHRKQKSI